MFGWFLVYKIQLQSPLITEIKLTYAENCFYDTFTIQTHKNEPKIIVKSYKLHNEIM